VDHLKVKEYFRNNIVTLEVKQKQCHCEFRVKEKSGHLVWLECKFFKNIKLNEKEKYLIGILKDITKQKQLEQFLWENLEKNIPSSNKVRKIKRDYNDKFKYESESNNLRSAKIQNKFPLRIKDEMQYITKREKEVMELIAFGYPSKQIASLLNISYHTVVSHRKNLINKFQVHNTAELINTALNSNWL
jgi:DNA-binding CsgD family transcriptional regulator